LAQAGTKDDMVDGLDGITLLPGVAVAAESDGVQADDPGAMAVGDHEGGHILGHAGYAADHGDGTEPTKLMDGCLAGQEHPVLHLDVAGQAGGICEDVVAAHDAVVSDVGVGHQEIVVSDPGALVRLDAAADVYAFLEMIAIPDGKGFAQLRPVSEILRLRADGGAVTDVVVASHTGGVVDAHAALNDTARPDDGPTLDDGVGPHLNGRVELGAALDDGGRMDAHNPPSVPVRFRLNDCRKILIGQD